MKRRAVLVAMLIAVVALAVWLLPQVDYLKGLDARLPIK